MKKLITMALTVGMALSMAACGGNSGSAGTTAAAAGSGESKAEVSADAKKLLYVHGASDTSILQTTAEYFKSLIEERTDGRYTVEIHPNFELGSLTESVQMIKSGDVQLSGVCLGSYYSDALAIVDLPNAVPTIEDAYKLYAESEFRTYIEDALRKENIEMLDFGAVYFREMTSNVEIHSADDIKGINIRTLENPFREDGGIAVLKGNIAPDGAVANPSPLAWAETYISLQQGLVDAQENPLDSIVGGKLYEVQKYVVNTNHIVYTSPILVNEDFFNSLSAEDQEIFRQAGKETEEYVYSYAREQESKLAQQLKDNGMEFIDLDEATLSELKNRASSVYDSVRKQVGDDIMDQFLAAVDQVTGK